MPRLESKAKRSERAQEALRRLRQLRSDSSTALDWKTPYELLTSVILSAQTTDVAVNKATPALFSRCPTVHDLAQIPQEELEQLISTIGLFRMKAKSLRKMANQVVEEHAGIIPDNMQDLVKLGGVGRKTANVVLGVAFGIPGLVVDTHVIRISNLLGLAAGKDAVKLEYALNDLLPEEDWTPFGLHIILHGRATCIARRPQCHECILADICPSAELND